MTQSTPYDFSKLVPGFDFLHKFAAQPARGTPAVSSWVAPTLDPKELEKRIQDLRTVKFWLEQNTQAVAATIQALEVQRMTLATLQGMNVSMGQLAEALKMPAGMAAPSSVPSAASSPAQPDSPVADASHPSRARKQTDPARGTPDAAGAAQAPIDPMAWWGALTQQFQHIAGEAMQDMQRQAQAQAQAQGQTRTKTKTKTKTHQAVAATPAAPRQGRPAPRTSVKSAPASRQTKRRKPAP